MSLMGDEPSHVLLCRGLRPRGKKGKRHGKKGKEQGGRQRRRQDDALPHDHRRRLGAEAEQPHRIKYKKL